MFENFEGLSTAARMNTFHRGILVNKDFRNEQFRNVHIIVMFRISNGTAQSFFNYTGTHFRSEFQDSESFADVFAPNQVSNNPNFTGSNANVFRNSFYCHLCYPLI